MVNIGESVEQKHAFADRTFAQKLSVNVHWLCHGPLFWFVLGSFKLDSVNTESAHWPPSICPSTRHCIQKAATLWNIVKKWTNTFPIWCDKMDFLTLRRSFGGQVPFSQVETLKNHARDTKQKIISCKRHYNHYKRSSARYDRIIFQTLLVTCLSDICFFSTLPLQWRDRWISPNPAAVTASNIGVKMDI